MPASTTVPPARVCAASRGASTFSGLARMLATTTSKCQPARHRAARIRPQRHSQRRCDGWPASALGSMSVPTTRPGTELARRDRENTAAATVVQDRLAGAQMLVQPAQTLPGRGMTAGAEREARIQPQHNRRSVRGLAPGGHDPQTWGDLDRAELLLSRADPVLIRNDLRHAIGSGAATPDLGASGKSLPARRLGRLRTGRSAG